MEEMLKLATYAAWTALVGQIRVYLMWKAHEKGRAV